MKIHVGSKLAGLLAQRYEIVLVRTIYERLGLLNCIPEAGPGCDPGYTSSLVSKSWETLMKNMILEYGVGRLAREARANCPVFQYHIAGQTRGCP